MASVSWPIAPTPHTRSLFTNDDVLMGDRPTPNINLSVIPPLSVPVPVSARHTGEGLDTGQNLGVSSTPAWISLIKPLPPTGERVITLRRDSHFALEIILDHLPREPPEGWDGIKVPATASVKNYANTTGKTLLEFRVHLYGATTNRRYEVACENCQKREGKRRGTPSLVDFKAEYDMIESKDGKLRVEFTFCCYPKCHKQGDMEYILDIILSEDEDQNQIVDRCRLPFSFNIQSKLPPGRTKRSRGDDPYTSESRKIRCGVGHQVALQGVRSREDNRSSSPPTVRSFQPLRDTGSNLGIIELPDHTTPKDRERAPTLTEVNPDSGSTAGGARIWLKGIDFPALFPLFARFGNAVVPTTFSSSNLLACHLPPSTPGMIHVTLSKQPQSDAPEYGTSVATFKYKGDLDEFITIILRIQGQAPSPLLQALLSVLTNQRNSAPHSSADSYEPVLAQSRGQFGGVFDPILGSSEGIRQPEQLHGGFGQSPTWTFPTNVASPLTHQSHGPNLGVTSTPFLNQAFNASASAQQSANQRPPSNLSLNYFGGPLSLRPTEYRNSDAILDRSPQVRFSGTSKDNQSTTPQRSTNSAGHPLPLATHRSPGGIQPPWQDKPRVHSSTPAIYEPIDSVNNLPTNSQASGIPAQGRRSTPGSIGIIPNMSALSRAASSASSILNSKRRLYLPDPVERFPKSYFGASSAPTLGDNGQMDHDDYEARALEPLAFKSMPLYRLPDDSTDANHLVSRTNRKEPRRRIRGPELVIFGDTTSSTPRISAYSYQGSARPQSARVPQGPMPEVVPDTMPEPELVLGMDESPLRSRLTRLVPPRTSPPAIPPLPPGASLPDHLKRLLPYGSVAFSQSDDGQVDGAMADEVRPPALPVLQPEDQSYGRIRSPSPQSDLTGSYEELSFRRQSRGRRSTADNERGRLLRSSEPSSPAGQFPFEEMYDMIQPMCFTPSSADPVVARRSRIRKNKARRDDRPQQMKMHLQFDSYPQGIPPPKIEVGSDEERTSWRTQGRVNEHIQTPNSHRVLHRRRKTLARYSPVQKRSPSSPHPSWPGDPRARSLSTRAQIGPRPNTIRKRTASGFGHNQQSSRQSEIPSAIAEVTSQIGSSLRRIMSGVRNRISQGLKLFGTPSGGTRRIPSNTIMNDSMPLSHARTDGSHSVGLQRSNASKLKRTRYPGSDEVILQHSKSHDADFYDSPRPEQQFGPPGDTETSSLPLCPVNEVPLTIFDGRLSSRSLQNGDRDSEMRGGLIETGLVAALTSLQSQPNFPETVSTTNDWGQTLAHLSIIHGYPYLLGHLVDWHINLALADANGLTALHYAYMRSDLEGVRILRRGGASDSVVDKLGRKPSDLQSEEFGLAIDMDAKVALG